MGFAQAPQFEAQMSKMGLGTETHAVGIIRGTKSTQFHRTSSGESAHLLNYKPNYIYTDRLISNFIYIFFFLTGRKLIQKRFRLTTMQALSFPESSVRQNESERLPWKDLFARWIFPGRILSSVILKLGTMSSVTNNHFKKEI